MVLRKAGKKKVGYKRKVNAPVQWQNQKYSTGDMAVKAFEGVQYLKGLINVEMKKQDQVGPVTIGSVWTNAVPFHAIAQGDTSGDRNGLSILAKSLSGNFVIKKHGSDSFSVVRMVIVRDMQMPADQTTITGTTIFEDNAVYSLLNRLTLGRFSILYDESFRLDDTGVQQHIGSISIPLNFHFRYNGTASTDIQKNGVYLLLITDENTYSPTIDFRFRTTYTDN